MKSLITSLFLILSIQAFSQSTNTIRGQITDSQSGFPLPGATVFIPGTDPVLGASSDADGFYTIENVPVGRHTLQAGFIGYESVQLANILVQVGKESVVDLMMSESVAKLNEVVISAGEEKEKALNEMASVSARPFTIEESQRFAGARNDVARMAANYAGVATPNDATNDIVIRGNSPNFLLWRLEGVDIPNPNHFGRSGSTGGPVSMINNNVLAASDFFTGAFPAGYGNALSGAFDLRMRNGNIANHEFMGQIGFNGFEAGAEGPLGIGKNSSYLINYRYSALALFSVLGWEFGTGDAIPYYQDVNFKFNMPTEKAGTFSLFGLGGASHIDFINSDKPAEEVDPNFYTGQEQDLRTKTHTGVVGLNHKLFLNKTTLLHTSLAMTYNRVQTDVDSIETETRATGDVFNDDFKNYRTNLNVRLNKKLNARHRLQTGYLLSFLNYDLKDSLYSGSEDRWETLTQSEGNTTLHQPYATWQFRPTGSWTFTAGLHASGMALNNTWLIEPRLGASWQFKTGHFINFGYGQHAKTPPLDLVFRTVQDENGQEYEPNNELTFSRARHYVIGYKTGITKNLNFKVEGYYQDLYDALVEVNPSSYSYLNAGSFTINTADTLTNGGTGTNYGVEVTLEQFMNKGLYFLLTASLYESNYKGSDGFQRNTAFNGQHIVNFLGGKEWKLNSKKENRTNYFVADGKITWAGGNYSTPIDLVESQQQGQTVYDESRAFSQKLPDYFRADIRLAYRMSAKKSTQEWALDIQNVTNRQNPFQEVYDPRDGSVSYTYQLGMYPMLQYRIMF